MCLTDGQGGATEGNKGLTAGTWHVLTVQQVPNSASPKMLEPQRQRRRTGRNYL